jgi:hypothetical protein
MAGKRNSALADMVTNWSRVRVNLTATDTATVEDDTIPLFSTEGGPNDVMLGQPLTDGNNYGRNAQINVAAVISGFSSVTLQLYLLVEEKGVKLTSIGSSSSSSDSAIQEPTTKMWVLVGSVVLTTSGLWVVKDIPPGKYKIRFSAKAGTGYVTVLESHAA